MTPLRIDVVSDVICPWCFIGARRLDQALKEQPEIDATIVYRPYQLDPTTPPEGTDLRERLRKKYGADPEQMFGRVEAAARETGIPLDFAKVRRTFATLPAHTLLRHAIAKGTQPGLKESLFSAYFLEGRDLGNPAVLAEVAARHGFSAEETARILGDSQELATTRDEAAALSAEGIQGVPYFIFGGRVAFSGAQPLEVFRSALQQAARPQ